MTQDFATINIPYFFTNDPRTYLILLEKARGCLLTKLTIPLALGPEGTGRINAFSGGRISNPPQVQYFSVSAVGLGTGRDRRPSNKPAPYARAPRKDENCSKVRQSCWGLIA
jgi:hypothetical protein